MILKLNFFYSRTVEIVKVSVKKPEKLNLINGLSVIESEGY